METTGKIFVWILVAGAVTAFAFWWETYLGTLWFFVGLCAGMVANKAVAALN